MQVAFRSIESCRATVKRKVCALWTREAHAEAAFWIPSTFPCITLPCSPFAGACDQSVEGELGTWAGEWQDWAKRPLQGKEIPFMLWSPISLVLVWMCCVGNWCKDGMIRPALPVILGYKVLLIIRKLPPHKTFSLSCSNHSCSSLGSSCLKL